MPVSASQSASVSGISSPSGRGSTRTNWPARAARAISGERTVNSTMPGVSSFFARIVWATVPVSV